MSTCSAYSANYVPLMHWSSYPNKMSSLWLMIMNNSKIMEIWQENYSTIQLSQGKFISASMKVLNSHIENQLSHGKLELKINKFLLEMTLSKILWTLKLAMGF